MKKIAILGSTGSIGTQALDVIAQHPDRFKVAALAAGKNIELLRQQAEQFKPDIATTADDGPEGLRRAALDSKADIILAATDGFVAFDAVFAAVERSIDIAVANKELIVAAGELLTAAAKKSGSKILPVDSEHSAIFQCLVGENIATVASIVLTASGGPFRTWTKDQIENATIEQALNHPTWQMGPKNTIDSATLMNKGLEIIEAARLFPLNNIKNFKESYKIVVHPQSLIHGFVVFSDGSVKSQLCAPNMCIPIGYALAYPDRLGTSEAARYTPRRNVGPTTEAMDGGKEEAVKRERSPEGGASSGFDGEYIGQLRALDLEPPDFQKFPCLALAYEALAIGGVAPAVLSAANEAAVAAFLAGRLSFSRIPTVIEKVMESVPQSELTLESVRAADRAARNYAANETR